MLRWAPYPFIRITLSLIAGILLHFMLGKDSRYSTEVFAFFVVAFILAALWSLRAKVAEATDMAGILGLLCFMAFGFWTTQLHTEKNNPQHLLHLPEQPAYYVGVVDDDVLQKPGYQSTALEVQLVQVNGKWQQAEGKVQLSIPHDSDQQYELSYGDELLIKGAPQEVAPPANPNQFDYRQYLANKGVYHRHYLQAFQAQKIGAAPPNTFLAASIHLRRQLDRVLRVRVEARREYAISSALILGVKDELDNSIRSAYASTGTMHVLAVSGLHVGLIYLVLMWLFSHLTPSVLRAVVMFSFVTVGTAIRRQTNIYNTIAIAAAVLLLLNPYNLKEVGFQLSFLAVLGIVYLQPKLYGLLEVDNWLLDKVWKLFTVAVAAQVATLPLGLYYFHQFPVYFWFANLVVVPVATLALYTGISALALHGVPVLGGLLFMLHTRVVWCMNWFNEAVQRLPYALLNGIDITQLQVWLLYALFMFLLLFIAFRKLRYFAMATAVVAVLSVQEVWETVQQKEQELLTMYNVHGATGIALVQGQQATVLADSVLLRDDSNYSFNIQPHLWHLGIMQPQLASLDGGTTEGAAFALLPDSNSLVVWKGLRILLLSHPPKLASQLPLPLDYLLLRNNVRLKPQDMQAYAPGKVVLDASNSPWYRKRLHQQLDTLDIAYYDVADSGALVVRLR